MRTGNVFDSSPGPRAEESSPGAFIGELERVFLAARRNAPEEGADLDFEIGGFRLRLSFAGPALIPRLTPALAARASGSARGSGCAAAPDLVVRLFDSATTRTRMPRPPWSRDDHGPRGEIRGYNDGRFFCVYSLGDGMLYMLDAEEGRGIFWIEDARRVPYYESGAPLRPILHWWMRDHGLVLTHAAAVGLAEGGVLIAGPGGSGKSTAALACLASPLSFAGDDYVLVETGTAPRVRNLYGSAKLEPAQLAGFPGLERALANRDRLASEKALLFLDRAFPGKLAAEFPLRALLVPRAGRPRTRLRPTTPARALVALAPSTLFQLPGAGNTEFRRLCALVNSLPCYELEMAADPAEIPRVVLDLLTRGVA